MPRPQPDGQRRQHDAGILRVLDLCAVAHESCSPDNAERAGQARADDDHDERADNREDDLRLHDGGRPLRGAPPSRPQRQRRPQGGGQGKRHERVEIDFPRTERLPVLLLQVLEGTIAGAGCCCC